MKNFLLDEKKITRLPEMFLSSVHIHDKMVLLEVVSKLAVFPDPYFAYT